MGVSVTSPGPVPREDPPEPLDLDGFSAWVGRSLQLGRVPAPEEALDRMLGGDDLARLRLAGALDRLTAGEARPLAEVHGAQTVRDLHLHYLYILSLPFEEALS